MVAVGMPSIVCLHNQSRVKIKKYYWKILTDSLPILISVHYEAFMCHAAWMENILSSVGYKI